MLKNLTLALLVSLFTFMAFGPFAVTLPTDSQVQFNTGIECNTGIDGSLNP